jgi:dienelactone hydrolase
MHLARCLAPFSFLVALVAGVGAQRLPAAAAAETLVYKNAGDTEVKLFIERASGWKAGDRRPVIVFLGEKADLIPVSVLEDFKAKMQAAGVLCDTRVFPGAAHGSFNKDVDGIPGFSETLADADRFCVALGWLAAKATP